MKIIKWKVLYNKMKRRKKNKVKLIFIILVIILCITTSVFGRYVINIAKDLYLTSKNFYFTSNILDINMPTYDYSNWGGVDTYQIDVDLYSWKNELLKLNYNLEYVIYAESNMPEKVRCSFGTPNGSATKTGVIYSDTNKVGEALYITPLTTLNTSDKITITIVAKATGEYEKEISAKIKLNITEHRTNIAIEDSVNSNYAILKLTNTNVTGTDVTLEFDPKVIRLDLNDLIYSNKKQTITKNVDGYNYISKIIFPIEKEATRNIKFYKVDKTKNYTYPMGNAECIIKVVL